MRSTPEEIVRIAVVPDAAKPLAIFDVIGGEQRHARIASDCEWVVITRTPEVYIAYFVDAHGKPGDFLEWDTLDEAIANAEGVGIRRSNWRHASYTRVEPSNPFAQFDASILRSLSGGDTEPAA